DRATRKGIHASHHACLFGPFLHFADRTAAKNSYAIDSPPSGYSTGAIMISPGEVAVFLTKANVEIANAAPNPLAPFIAGGGPVAEGFISPGQPLNINWTYWSFVGDRASVPQITVNIYGAAPSSLQFAASRLFSSGP